MSRITKPCPGCGQTGNRSRADKVCHDCAHAIEQWNKHTEKINSDKKNEYVPVNLIQYPHWYPGFHYHGHGDEYQELRDDLRATFCNIAPLLCYAELPWRDARTADAETLYTKRPVTIPDGSNYGRCIYYPATDGSSSYSHPIGMMRREVFDMLDSLWDMTARFSHMAYLGGVQEGRNMLLQLSIGELSVSDFQEQDVKLAQQVQDARFMHKELGKKKKKR